MSDKWEYVKYEKIVYPQFFNQMSKCKGNVGRQTSQECAINVVYHRCDPVPTNFYSKYEDLKGAELELKKQEAIIGRWMKHRKSEDRASFEAAMLKVKTVMDQLERQKFTGEKEFARKSLHLRAASNLITDLRQDDEKKNEKLMKAQGSAIQFFEKHERENPYAKVDRSTWRTFAWSNNPADEPLFDPTYKTIPKKFGPRRGSEHITIQDILLKY